MEVLAQTRQERAQQIASAGGIGVLGPPHRLPRYPRRSSWGFGCKASGPFFCVFGHGSTEIGEVLRIYQDAGLVRVCGVRSEIEASHAAAASALGARRKGRGRHLDRSGSTASAGGLHCPALGRVGHLVSARGRDDPRTRGRICSRFPGRNKTPSCGCSAP